MNLFIGRLISLPQQHSRQRHTDLSSPHSFFCHITTSVLSGHPLIGRFCCQTAPLGDCGGLLHGLHLITHSRLQHLGSCYDGVKH